MSNNKRKADVLEGETPAENSFAAQGNEKVTVIYRDGPDVAKPVIASAPGVSLPSNLKFQSFTRKANTGKSELLLHSVSHPTVDFTATEDTFHSNKHLKHYVAVYDPVEGKLQITEARRMTARSRIRQRGSAADSDEDTAEDQAVTNYTSRAALTHAFGTKKSKKAVQSMAENRLLARGGDDANNPLANAILSSMPEVEERDDTKETAQANKPLPTPNLATNDINEFYPLTSLIFPPTPSKTLNELPIAQWLDNVTKGKKVSTMSRYIVARVMYITKAHLADPTDAKLMEKVRLLRYILLLIELATYLRSIKHGKPIPPAFKWPAGTISGNVPVDLLTKIVEQFSPDGRGLGKHGTTLLQTTILALTLHIPPPSLKSGKNALVSDTSEIQLDLALKPEEVRKLYAELGCKSIAASDASLELWGLNSLIKKIKKGSEDGATPMPRPRFAKLSFPVEFPMQRSGRPTQRKR